MLHLLNCLTMPPVGEVLSCSI